MIWSPHPASSWVSSVSHTYFEEDVQPPAVNVDPGEPSAPDALAVFLHVTHMMQEYYNKRESLLTARFYDERLTLLPLLGKRVYPAPCEPSKYDDDYDVTMLPEGSEFHTCYGRLFWRFGAALQSDVGSSVTPINGHFNDRYSVLGMINIFNALLIRATELSLANCGVEVYHNLIMGMDSRSEVHVTLEKCCGTLRKFETLLPRVIRSLSKKVAMYDLMTGRL
ncbi:uncharacterized protein CIMG_07913 [Coccidioides immitis RS]|uniref:Uncharacterized protein n=4 Tax=Coccidioides immitis TaxID=5501 RepID=J3K4E1_COCIM|nr:uncharacterized protein CIMG_07913 [Coccidioides immitis RS]EAS29167.3 hypothetical protein CIMG_07913 [Coccidioides immitis RS]KMP06288.1 hypothetical protein CIRG_05969 [Coccidioides immitis RMSCC 2394]KMU80509.1 hypothetical protein CISG_02360 [Coccidioides immitis RMSCC 3703]KMU91332.1 hypothetical protein CIHG_09209 [Coccidioides immitis H538.4]